MSLPVDLMKAGVVLVAIDPGKHASGIAEFDGGILTYAWLGNSVSLNADEFVVEIPQVYRTGLRKGDPNDLIDLAFAAGMMIGQADPHDSIDTTKVRPSVWKGQAKKDVIRRRIEKRLQASEMQVMAAVDRVTGAKAHNVWDAVGIGMWRLGRFK